MTIGKGRFAKVRMVTDRKSGKSFAAKLVSKHIYQDKRDILLRELQVMCKLDHQHVVKLYGAYESDDALILVCDLGEWRTSGRHGATPLCLSKSRDPFLPRAAFAVQGGEGREYSAARVCSAQTLARPPVLLVIIFSPPTPSPPPLKPPSHPLSRPHPQRAVAICPTASPTVPPPSLPTKPAA
jgi:hypothetical protein